MCKTPASLKSEANKNNGCTYKGFMACNPKEYDGKGGEITLTRWMEKMENVIDNSGCAENQKVKYDASLFVNKALTWRNTQVQARGREVAIVGANHAGYTDQFHELAKLVPHLVTPESSRIKRYIDGLAPEIRGMLQATQPTIIQSAILRAGILTDESRAKVSKRFVAATPHGNSTAGTKVNAARLQLLEELLLSEG
ncbi:hypothetical protein Tco_1033571 [Tanacetum coccineum]